MDDLPSPYDTLPDAMKTVILTTYYEDTVADDNFCWDLGFSSKKEKIPLSLEQLLDQMRDSGRLGVLKDIYDRSLFLPGLWHSIRTIAGIWTYPQGREISQGFQFVCSNGDRLKDLMDSAARVPNSRFCAPGNGPVKFCRDDPTFAEHGNRDCYRELIKSGPGLHVCVTRRADRATLLHDIHIDKFQQVCSPKANGECDYDYANLNSLRHMKDAAPWWIEKKLHKVLG